MTKGKSFEQLVHIIQETLKDRLLTKVLPNVKLKSKTGQYRQFDVVIDASVSGYDIRLAIECKDYGRKVESSAIEAFHTKCDLVGGIHRRIFVSNAGFQKGAIASAKALGIELHILEEVKGDRIIGWIDTQQIYNYKFSRKYNKVDVVLVSDEVDTPPESVENDEIVYYIDGQSSTYIDFLEWLLREDKIQRTIKNLMMFQIPDFQAKGTINDEHPIEISSELPPYAFFKINEKDLFIAKVSFSLGIFIHEEKSNPEDIRIMYNVGEESLKAGVLTFPYDKDGSKLQMVIDPLSGNFKHFVINPDGSIRHELKTLAKYDPKTQEYEFPDEGDK